MLLIILGCVLAPLSVLLHRPAGTWTYTHRQPLRIGAVALAALIFVLWGPPTAAVTIVIPVLPLVVLGLIELIGRPAPQRAPTPPAPGG